ncbi:MAG: outer membrane beta-barrel protein [Bacteroidota bacterium]
MRLKIILLFALLATAVPTSIAQVLVGPVIGAQTTWTSFDDKDYKSLYKVEPTWGFHAGMNLSFRVRKRFFLHSSFIYSQKGRVIKGEVDPLLKHKARFNYFEVPMLYTVEFKGHVKGGKEFKWYLGAGPNISYWLGGRGEIYEEGINERNISQTPLKYKIVFDKETDALPFDEMNVQDPNKLQLGLNLSAGIVFEPFGYQKFMLTGRFELGHSFLSKTGSGVFSSTDKYQDVLQVRNNGFWLSLAYLVDLKVEDRKKGKSTIKKKRL